ncbi:MAG: hypothetical protein J6Q15_00865, partial [Clostridia bacterium]|nr:hypothetical protein [Clostridia bacterium]
YILGTADAAKELTVDLTGTTINAYVRVGVKITVLDASGNDELFKNDGDKQDGLTEDQVVVFDTEVTGWEYVNGYFYLVESGKAKAVSATPAALPLQAYINKLVGKDSSRALMGAQISIEITAAALQADYLGATETSTFTATQLDAAWAHIVGNTGDYAA